VHCIIWHEDYRDRTRNTTIYLTQKHPIGARHTTTSTSLQMLAHHRTGQPDEIVAAHGVNDSRGWGLAPEKHRRHTAQGVCWCSGATLVVYMKRFVWRQCSFQLMSEFTPGRPNRPWQPIFMSKEIDRTISEKHYIRGPRNARHMPNTHQWTTTA